MTKHMELWLVMLIKKILIKNGVHFFYKNQIIFVEARCSYSEMAKIPNFAHTLPLFYAFKMLFRMSTFISINSMIRNLASSWVTSPDGRKSEPNCSYKVCSYKRKKCILTKLMYFVGYVIDRDQWQDGGICLRIWRNGGIRPFFGGLAGLGIPRHPSQL